MREHHYLRGYLCASGGAILWGLSGTAGQYLLHHYQVDSFWISSVRLLTAGLLLMLLATPYYKKMIEMMKSRRNALLLFCYAVFGLLMSQTAFYATIEHANAATAAVLQTLSVVMMALFVCLRSWRVPTRAETISILLALAGVFLIVTNGNLAAMILSPKALSWGTFGSLSQRLLFFYCPRFGLALGQYYRQCTGHAGRRPDLLPLIAALEYPGQPGFYRLGLVRRRHPDWHGYDVYSLSPRCRRHRSGQSNVIRHIGTGYIGHCRFSFFRNCFLSARTHGLCLCADYRIYCNVARSSDWLTRTLTISLSIYKPAKGMILQLRKKYSCQRYHADKSILNFR